eukprot:CAMPEP_0174260832 /NCGR_PEP_ID=MMETSP0439-20130205/10673_1 /TAXON_ID=0 /ORGANISM="Stereomyxa ramosa, Strain Chinc5" /LENGTH=443 /DNA_ID=CAMNT_0015345171 /DNA_START=46 /DNA_END=1377 /DNA_ORIENTATION=+
MPVMAKFCPEINITVVDIDEEKIAAWNSDNLPIYEPGLQEIVTEQRGKNLFFTSAELEKTIKEAEVIFIAVNTGTKSYGYGSGSAYDLTSYEAVARSIAKCATEERSYVVVEKSTVPVRTAEEVRRVLNASKRNPKIQFEVVSNPEFLAEGTAVKDLVSPDRVLIGGGESKEGAEAAQKVVSLYSHWVPEDQILTTNVWTSELSKLAANAFLAQRISTVNALSAVCEETGANIDDVSRVVGRDSRVGSKYLKTSVGWGGSCFKKDLNGLIYLCDGCHLHEVAEYFRQVIKLNEYQKKRFCQRILREMFNTIRRKKIVLLGFAFKKNTGDTRESPAIDVCEFLVGEGADVYVYDPKVSHEEIKGMFPTVTCADVAQEALVGAHAILLLTEWDEFLEYDYEAIFETMERPAFVFDGRNILDQKRLRDIGYLAFSVGTKSDYHLHL